VNPPISRFSSTVMEGKRCLPFGTSGKKSVHFFLLFLLRILKIRGVSLFPL